MIDPIEEALFEMAFHALRIKDWREPWDPYRNRYSTGGPNRHIETLVAAGFVESVGQKPAIFGDLEFWRVTPAGIEAARRLHAKLWKAAGLKTWSVYIPKWIQFVNAFGFEEWIQDGWEYAGAATATTRSKARYAAWLKLLDALPELRLHQIKVGRQC